MNIEMINKIFLLYAICSSKVLYADMTVAGKLEHLFDEYTNIHVSDVAFFPSERGRSYDFYASSVDKNDVLYINLASGKVEMIEGDVALHLSYFLVMGKSIVEVNGS